MKLDRLPPVRTSLKPSNHPYLNGPWTPLHEEVNAEDLVVLEGVIPTDVDGVYIRNTENPVHEALGRYHPFDGDGMLHMIDLQNGRANYRNRFVRTKAFQYEQEKGSAQWGTLMDPPGTSKRPGQCAHDGLKDASSTDVVVHAGKALSTFYQCGDGYKLDPVSLEQDGIAGWVPIDGISAHPKVDERTGELLFFNYSVHPPYMHYGVVDKHDKLIHYVPVPLPGPRLPHDMAFTEHYSILNDCPAFWDPVLLEKGVHAVRFYPDMKTRFAIIPRYGKTEDVKWFEADPTYVLHWLNAYEDGDEVVLDGYFQENPTPAPTKDAPRGYEMMISYLDQYQLNPRLHRWRFNLKTGETREERIDDRVLEFGMFNQRYGGRRYRYVYSATSKPGWFLFTGFVKHDMETRQSWSFTLPEGQYASEAPFVPRIGAKDEDDGYIISFIVNELKGRSECILIDAKKIEQGPVCRIALPHKISSGTHSCWAPRERLSEGA